MKKLIIILAIFLNGCSSDEIEILPPSIVCYNIISIGEDSKGDYVKIDNNGIKRYQVDNYMDYAGQYKICDLSNLKIQN